MTNNELLQPMILAVLDIARAKARNIIHVVPEYTGCPVKIRLCSFKYNFFCDRTILKNLILK
jgi:hypothetical protein